MNNCEQVRSPASVAGEIAPFKTSWGAKGRQKGKLAQSEGSASTGQVKQMPSKTKKGEEKKGSTFNRRPVGRKGSQRNRRASRDRKRNFKVRKWREEGTDIKLPFS